MAKKNATQSAPDKQPALNKHEDFILKYKNIIIGAVVALVVIIVGIVYFNNHKSNQLKEAQTAMQVPELSLEQAMSELNASAQSSLTNFAQNVLLQNTDMNVGIVGYTDNDPWKGKTAAESVAANQQLSQQRAQAVSNFLKSKGVSNNQIKEVAGLGESNPVADNSTAAGKAQNRRVEVYLYASDEMIKQAQAGTLQ